MPALDIQLDFDDGGLASKLEQDAVAVERFAQRVTNTSSSIKKMEDSSRNLLSTMRDLSVGLGQAKNAFENVAEISTGWIHKIVEVNAEFERMTSVMRSLSTASDPLKDATDKVRLLREEAKNAPFSLNAIHSAMTRLSSVSLGTKENMQSLMDAVAAFGGTDNELNRASLAFQEMAGKGVVQMKELRNQLMMAVPNAGNLLARAFGESYEQMMSDIHTGTVDAKSTINGLMLEFDRAFGGDAQRQMKTFNGLVGQTAVLLQSIAVEDVGQPLDSSGLENKLSFFGVAKEQIKDFNAFLQTDTAKVMGQDLGEGLTTAVRMLRSMVDEAISLRGELETGAKWLAIGFGTKIAFSAISGLGGAAVGLGAKFMSLGKSWQGAMAQIEAGSATTALRRIEALRSRATAATDALQDASKRSEASSVLAQEARTRARTAPTAASRSTDEQRKLDQAASRAEDSVNRAQINLQRIREQSEAESRESILNKATIAAAAQDHYEDVYTRPSGSTELQRARASEAMLAANENLRLERLRAERMALEQVAKAERDLQLAEEERDARQAASVSVPAASERGAAEQAALNLAAINAQRKARTDAAAAESAEMRAISLNAAANVAEVEGTGSRIARAMGAAASVLPVVATGFGAIITAAPLAAMAIGLLSDYFDIFNTHAQDAWENLEHYGAASLKAAHEGDAYVKQLHDQIEALEARQKMAKASEGMPIADQFGGVEDADLLGRDVQAAKANAGKADADQAKMYQQGMTNDAKQFASERMETLDREFSGYQLLYNKSSNEAATAHSKTMNDLAAAHRSVIGETQLYQQEQKKRALDLYDAEIAAINKDIAAMDEYKKSHKGIADQMKADEYLGKLQDRLADRTSRRQQESDQDMGLFKNVKPLDEKKLIQNADNELERLQASIEGYKAGIEGSDQAAEQLYQVWLKMGKAGDQTTEEVRNALNLMKELKATADDYQKIMEGGHKLSKDIDDAIDKAQDQIFNDQHGKDSSADQIRAKMAEGRYAGFGGTDPEAQRLTTMREALDKAAKSGVSMGDALATAVGPNMVSNVERLTNAFRGLADPLLAIQNGVQGIKPPQSPGNGSIMYGPAGEEVQWNNPGNLNASALSTQFGGVPGGGPGGRFAMFPTAEAGYQAANANLDAYARMGLTTPRQIINRWAPAGDGNDPTAYANSIAKAAGVDVDSNLPSDKRGAFLRAMTQIEKGKAPPFTAEQISAMINRTPAEAAGRRPISEADRSDRELSRLDAIEAQAKKVRADKGVSDLEEKYKSKDIAEAMEAGGAGKNFASMVAYIREHGKDTTVGSNNENDPRWKTAIDIAKKRDADDENLKTLREKTTAADSAQKTNREKLTSSGADLANVFDRLAHNGNGVSEAVEKDRDAARQRTSQVVARYGADSPQARQAQGDESTIVANARSKDAADDALAAQKKTIALRESTMTQEQSDTDRYNQLKRKYQEDLDAFKGTADQKAAISKAFNDNLAAEQQSLADKTPLAKEMKDWGDTTKNLQSSMSTMMNSSVDSLSTYIMTGQNQWRTFADSITKDLLTMGLKEGISGLMSGTGLTSLLGGGASKAGAGASAALGGGGTKMGAGSSAPTQLAGAAAGGGGAKAAGGMFGMLAGVHHEGGIAGGGENRMRFFPVFHPSFASAPRYHTGGITGDEVPIIAQKGEGVFTKGQMAAIGKGMSGANGHTFNFSSNVNVNSNGGDPSQNADLAKQVGDHVDRVTRATVIAELTNQMRPGNLLAADPTNIFGRS